LALRAIISLAATAISSLVLVAQLVPGLEES
jgi:hypothetical protein